MNAVGDCITANGYRFCEWVQKSMGGVQTWCDTAGCYVYLGNDGRSYIYDEFGASFDPPWKEEPKIVEAARRALLARQVQEVT